METPSTTGATSGSELAFEPRPRNGSHDGKTAIVTGASANLGRMFASNSPRTAPASSFTTTAKPSGEKPTSSWPGSSRGGRASACRGDLTRVDDIARRVDTTFAQFGRWDTLVNTAGMLVRKPIAEFEEQELDRLFAISTGIPFFLMREAASGWPTTAGSIDLITTVVAVTAPTYGGYAGSKSPVEHFSKSLAKEISARGVTVNCVAPGPLKTSFFDPAETNGNLAWLRSMSINGDIGEPTDVVPLVRFLASPEARWITAQTVYVNGGLVAPAS